MQTPSGLHWVLIALLLPLTWLYLAVVVNLVVSFLPILLLAAYRIHCYNQRAKAEQGRHDLGHFNKDLSEHALDDLTRELAKKRQL